MNSFNHYAYGAIGDWMYRIMVGIDTYEDGVGYKHSRIKPHVGGGSVMHRQVFRLTTANSAAAGNWRMVNFL